MQVKDCNRSANTGEQLVLPRGVLVRIQVVSRQYRGDRRTWKFHHPNPEVEDWIAARVKVVVASFMQPAAVCRCRPNAS